MYRLWLDQRMESPLLILWVSTFQYFFNSTWQSLTPAFLHTIKTPWSNYGIYRNIHIPEDTLCSFFFYYYSGSYLC